jgi:Gpi18-like mannosyltransferase
MTRTAVTQVTLLWLAWVGLLCAFQEFAPARLVVPGPDYALAWTASETRPSSDFDKPYLLEPFLNRHVAWDSEFYLAIATGGYDDPQVRSLDNTSGIPGTERLTRPLSLSYAFMPFYPIVMRGVAVLLSPLPLNPVALATLAGVLVSAVGALGAMLALYDLAREELGDDGGWRAALYLILFPTGFFLAQVYTEGLFVGLAFGSMALVRRKQWLWAALLAVGAVWTRTVGIALVIPLAWAWWTEARATGWTRRPAPWALVGKALLVLLPLAAYLAWRFSFWGQAYQQVEDLFFDRGPFLLDQSWLVWTQAVAGMFGTNTQWTAYYLLEFGAVALGLVATWATLRRYPDLALFGLAVLVVSFTSGVAQGMLRYVLAMPVIYIYLSRLGQTMVFDRAWSLGSTLLMGMMTLLYSFNMWAG